MPPTCGNCAVLACDAGQPFETIRFWDAVNHSPKLGSKASTSVAVMPGITRTILSLFKFISSCGNPLGAPGLQPRRPKLSTGLISKPAGEQPGSWIVFTIAPKLLA